MSSLQIVQMKDSARPVIFGLGGGDQQSIISSEIPDIQPGSFIPEVWLKPLFGPEQLNEQAAPSAEAQLFYERMRSHVVSGLTGFSWHPGSESLLLSSFNRLKMLSNGQCNSIAEWFSGTILNATVCPSDADFVAFCSGGQLFIDCRNTQFYSTKPVKDHTHGVASFIAQEELERFEGYWWNPVTTEVLYEEVDESQVAQLSFEIPGKRIGDPMRYPVTGTSNPTSKLKLISLDKSTSSVVERGLPATLEELFPWYEYLVRVGWMNADFCYSIIMNRKQTKQALILIDKRAFGATGATPEQIRNQFVFVVYEEQSDIWLNSNNLLHFLSSPASEIRFIYGSEKSDFCHLYLQSCQLKNNGRSGLDIVDLKEIQVTSGDWPVIKEAPMSIDENRGHTYFLANKISPLITSLCVASYTVASDTKILTPPDLCYRQERGQFNLNVNPEIGFVAWVSSISHLPECRFYKLVHSGPPVYNSPLPEAVFQFRVRFHASIMNSPGKEAFEEGYTNISLKDCFRTEFIEYKSVESDLVHNAVVFIPAVKPRSITGTYPVIHHVYAGPSVQQVRNSWPTAAQFLRYLTLGYAVVVVDGRGSANRGVKFEGAIKNNLGTVEVQDQIEGLQECLTRISCLDRTRIAVTGWSYGGYMALLLLSNHPDIYKAACAGGAVSDWNLYDTCYTERYMDLPKDNPLGYKAAGVVKLAHKFPNDEGRLLIVHGLIDENVHFHHTEQLINALIAAGKPFEQLIFPSERHGVRQGSAIEFFHASQLSFFAKAFK